MRTVTFLMLVVSCSFAHAIRPIDGPFEQEGPRYHEALKGNYTHSDRLRYLRSNGVTETQILAWHRQMGHQELLLRTLTDLIILEESGDPALRDAEPIKLISHHLWRTDAETVTRYLRLADLAATRCRKADLDEFIDAAGSAIQSAPLKVRANTAALYAQVLTRAHSRRQGPCAGSLTVASD